MFTVSASGEITGIVRTAVPDDDGTKKAIKL